MYRIVDTLVEQMSKQYPYLIEKQEIIKENTKLEEERFFATIDKGMAIFEEELKNTKGDLFSGEVAFKLYDTYGFPLDLTQDMLRSVNKSVEIDMFEKLMNEQKTRAKAAWKGSGDSESVNLKPLIEKFGENKFVGYEKTKYKSKILALLDENFNLVDELNGNGWVMCEETPFYAESGGQIGDTGTINAYEVSDTKKFNGINLSFVKNAKLKVNDEVECIVDKSRHEIAKHHSATHLLHAACRMVLGEQVTQAGSLVEENKLRFDITHPKAITNEELEKIEFIVNEMIAKAIDGVTEELPIEEAKKKGAMALFGEKYGDIVRVVSFGDASVEFCGGTHVKNTAEIGSFYITKESGVSAGVRRIEAVAGMSAYKYAKNNINEIKTLKAELKAQDIFKAIGKLKSEIKSQKDEIKKLKSASIKELNKTEKNGIVYIIDRVDNADLKELVDKEKNRYDKIFIFLIGEENSKVKMACGAKNVDIKAGKFIKEIAPIVKGGGGGRDDFAQAGGKDTSKINEALNQAKEKLL
jgi:alanyl-tRNA synthetase